MSLPGLIHHYMWEQNLYHLVLNDEELEICRGVVEDQPEAIYGPEDESTQSMLDEIQSNAICFVGKKLIKDLKEKGHDIVVLTRNIDIARLRVPVHCEIYFWDV